MPRIIDVIDHVNVMDDEFSYREPQQGSGDWRMGSQVIVGESQSAIFVRAGQALDALPTGRHTLSVANLPILSGLIGLATSGRTPFTADLYFINHKDMPNLKWGTTSPIPMETPGIGMGAVLLTTFGTMNISVSDPMLFLKKLAIGKPMVRFGDVKDAVQTKLVGELTVLLARSGAKSIPQANALLSDLEGAMLAQVSASFEADFGLQIRSLDANPFQAKQASREEMLNYVDIATWERIKRLDIAEKAAGNEGAAGAAIGAGLGFGVGNTIAGTMDPNAMNNQQMMQQMMMQQQLMMQQMMQQNQPKPPAESGGGGAVATPQTKEEIIAFIDQLDVRLMNGEISEAVYNRMLEKWQKRLEELGG